jgi:hypothetical protein
LPAVKETASAVFVSDRAAGGTTVTVVTCELPLRKAMSVTVWLLVTTPAVAVKVAVLEKAATVTVAGTVKKVLLDESDTTVPPPGATCESVTVQMEIEPEVRAPGAQLKPETLGRDVRLIAALAELPFREAVTIADWLLVITPAVAVKFAAVEAAATVTLAGSVNRTLLDDSETSAPPTEAACERLTVQMELEPELRLLGEHARLETKGRGASGNAA